MRPSRILIVEDEPTLQETLEYNLTHQGYDVRVAGDGPSALATASSFEPDLVLLDVMLPGVDGFEVCRILRQKSIVPILMLTARDTEIDRVLGLEIGADDYLAKPFSMRELQARLKAMLRRVRMDHQDSGGQKTDEAGGERVRFGNLELNFIRHEVTLDGQALLLNPREYELLVYMARHKGQVLSRDQILESVWGWDFTGGSRTVDVHVRWLREKIETHPAKPVRIVTVRGAGYRFEG
ncbi:MAG TPA: response regulator transcription factor [Anaerolineales bacterium]|nr:response regulator transcription factor [Anaerolineales bacterium]